MKWFCRLCWRHGDLFVAMPEDEAIKHAIVAHRNEVAIDMEAVKVPVGLEGMRDRDFMDKYPSVDCAGEIELGTPHAKGARFDKRLMPSFDFDAAPISTECFTGLRGEE